MNYSKLIQENGKTYIFAEDLFNEKSAQMARLQAAYIDIRIMLIDAGFPAGKAWITAIADSGADGLERVLRLSVSQEIKRLAVPFYMADTYQAAAREHVSPDLWTKADELRATLQREGDGLPIQAGDIVITDTAVKIDTEAVLGRIRAACMLEITQDRMSEADRLLDLAAAVRALELAGVNALELVKKYMDAPETPAPLELYADAATRRHLPGQISQVIQMPLATFASMYKPK